MLSFLDLVLRNNEQPAVLRPPMHDWRSRASQALVAFCGLILTAYFAYHSLYGRHGFEVRQKLIERSGILEFEIRSLEAVRSKLERDVALLSPELPNPDLVEEIARDVLGYVRPEDKIMLRRSETSSERGAN